MQIKLLTLDDWLIVTVSQLSWFHCITRVSLVPESASHAFIFSTDKSNTSRSCETGSQAGHRGLLSSCLFCTPSLFAERRCPGLLRLIPLDKSVSFGKRRVKSKIILQRLSLRFGDAHSIRRVGSAIAGQAGCPCHGSYKAVGRCRHHGYCGHNRVQQRFCWYFLQKCTLKELPYSNRSKAGYNCKDVVGADMEVR